MNKNTIFLAIFFAISIQALLTFFQIKNYNNEISRLKKMGRVGIGSVKGKLSKGIVVLLCVDNENKILSIAKMEGLSVFARFKEDKEFDGAYIYELYNKLNSEDYKNFMMNKKKKIFYNALLKAIDTIK